MRADCARRAIADPLVPTQEPATPLRRYAAPAAETRRQGRECNVAYLSFRHELVSPFNQIYAKGPSRCKSKTARELRPLRRGRKYPNPGDWWPKILHAGVGPGA